jgi:hypothetical protein
MFKEITYDYIIVYEDEDENSRKLERSDLAEECGVII